MFASKDLFATRGGYRITKSLRFRSSASAYLSRTLGTPTLNTKLTFSGWVKRGTLGSNNVIFSLGQPTGTINYLTCQFISTNVLQVYGFATSNNMDVSTVSVFRDTSAWYHFVVVIDTTQSTGSDRVKIYLNGVQQAVTTTVTIGLGAAIPANVSGYIGGISTLLYNAAYVSFFDGYMAEVNFIDGQALDATSFGQTDNNGVWQPKAYTGTYGTNGFYLKFADASGATATTIGKDSSPNGNNWTPNNISVTSGTTYDSMLDSPTNFDDGGNGRGNYCVLNSVNGSTNASITEGNLSATGTTANYASNQATFNLTSGKWYFEMTKTTTTANVDGLGLVVSTYNKNSTSVGDTGSYTIADANTSQIVTISNGGASVIVSTTNWANNDVIQCAYDADSGKVWFGRNGTWYPATNGGTVGDPAAGTNPTITAVSGLTPIIITYNTSSTNKVNFGQRPFTYTPPSGFKALNTQNLTTPTIMNGAAYMAAVTYTGSASTQSVTATATNSGNNPLPTTFQPDLVWIKDRTNAQSHKLTDAVRGTTKAISTDSTAAEATDANGVTAFNNNGFSVGTGTRAYSDSNLDSYVAWQWKESSTAGFDIVQYAGDNTSNRNISHALGVAPDFVWVKSLSTGSFYIWHRSLSGNTSFLKCNSTDGTNAQTTTNTPWGTGNWSSTQFMVTNNATNNLNAASTNYIAYLWDGVAGYSAFGSYTGNGSPDGPFVYLGFRPRFIMVKNATTGGAGYDWYIWDASRATYNVIGNTLVADLSDAEFSAANIDILSNGFKMRTTSSVVNGSGNTIIYAAFAENPFKISRAR